MTNLGLQLSYVYELFPPTTKVSSVLLPQFPTSGVAAFLDDAANSVETLPLFLSFDGLRVVDGCWLRC